MKKLAFVLAFVSLAAHAEVITQGGFGTDGATGESMPKTTSVKDAVAVYKALNVQADGRGKKIIEISDESNFECEKPYSGISRVNAGCMFILRASQGAKVTARKGLSGTVTFKGELATKIHAALPADTSGRVGASVKEVANLSCVKPVVPRAVATCTIKSTNVLSLDVKL